MAKKIENDPSEFESGESGNGNTGVNLSERRVPRSIRFSDSEWNLIEGVAKEHGMAAAELVRHASIGFSTGKVSKAPAGNFQSSLTKISAQVERIYNGVYLLATLKRDEMVTHGRSNELESIIKDACQSRELLYAPESSCNNSKLP